MKINYKSSMFIKLFVTYFILFTMLCVLFSLALLKQIENKHQAVRQRENRNQVELLARILDERFTDIDKIGTQLIGMDWVKRVRSQSDIIMKNIDLLKRQEICHQMNAYQSIIRVSKSTALLLPHKNITIDSVSFWSTESYLTSIGLHGQNLQELLIQLPDSTTSLVLTKPSISDDTHFFVMKQLNYASAPELVLFVYMDGLALSNLLHQSYESGLSHMEIQFNNDTLFTKTWEHDINAHVYSQTIPSSLFAWDYYFEITPPQSSQSSLILLMILIFLADIILGIAIAFLASKMSYAPIGELLYRLGVETDASSSEIVAIENVFITLRKEKHSFELLSHQYFNMAKNNLLIIVVKLIGILLE